MTQTISKPSPEQVEAADKFLYDVVDPFYEAWSRGEFDEFRDGLLDYCTPVTRAAVGIQRLLGQVLNGGFSQWADNGYVESADLLVRDLEKVGTPAAWETVEIVMLAVAAWRRDEDEGFDEAHWTRVEQAEDKFFDELADQLIVDLAAWVKANLQA